MILQITENPVQPIARRVQPRPILVTCQPFAVIRILPSTKIPFNQDHAMFNRFLKSPKTPINQEHTVFNQDEFWSSVVLTIQFVVWSMQKCVGPGWARRVCRRRDTILMTAKIPFNLDHAVFHHEWSVFLSIQIVLPPRPRRRAVPSICRVLCCCPTLFRRDLILMTTKSPFNLDHAEFQQEWFVFCQYELLFHQDKAFTCWYDPVQHRPRRIPPGWARRASRRRDTILMTTKSPFNLDHAVFHHEWSVFLSIQIVLPPRPRRRAVPSICRVLCCCPTFLINDGVGRVLPISSPIQLNNQKFLSSWPNPFIVVCQWRETHPVKKQNGWD